MNSWLTEKKDMDEDQILPTFQLYSSLMDSLTPDQMTWKVHHQLKGLKKCLEEGENPDFVPNPKQHRYEKYYEWYYWYDFTQSILDQHPEARQNPNVFHFHAMLTFIRVANEYLKFLHVIR
jgi:hypothetical protein